MKRSVISDVTLEDWRGEGPPILFTNREIRRMLDLAKAGERDVFYDLGSGWGQNLIIALTEYHVKKAVGVEDDKDRFDVATKRLQKWKIPKERWTMIRGQFEKVLSGKVKEADLTEATIIFYGLETDPSLIGKISKNLSEGARLVYYYNCLFPEIMPIEDSFPFYLSKKPFIRPGSELDWLLSVVRKKRSSIADGDTVSVPELWDELRHDYDVNGIGDPVRDYRSRLLKSVAVKKRILE